MSILSAETAAKAAFDEIKKRSECGRAGRFWPNEPAFREEFINDEWLYLDVFIFDYSIYRAFGNTPERQLVLNKFQNLIAGWLRNRIVSKIPDVRLWMFDPGEEPLFFPPEIAEPAVTRLTRRMESYSKAVALHHEMGENLSVASVFAAHCGASSFDYIAGVGRYVFEKKMNFVKMLKVIQPTATDESQTEISQLKNNRGSKGGNIDLGISIDGVRLQKVGQVIDLTTMDKAGLVKPGFIGRMMLAKTKTNPNDIIFYKKNCLAIECESLKYKKNASSAPKASSYRDQFQYLKDLKLWRSNDLNQGGNFSVTCNVEVGNGDMWGNTIILILNADGLLKKVVFQVIMNKSIAELNLLEFRMLCANTFGEPKIATEQVHIWEDRDTSVVSARNGKDAVFEWEMV